MKRFVRKVLILFIVSIGILEVYNCAYQIIRLKGTPQYSEYKFKKVPYDIEISNTGSSHGMLGYDYGDYASEKGCFNFALTSQSLSYDYRILKQYEDRLVKGGIMFITISNFSFGMDEVNEPAFESKNERYYTFLKPEYIKNFSMTKYIEQKYFNVFYQDPITIIDIVIDKINERLKQSYQTKENKDILADNEDGFDYENDAVGAYERHIRIDENGTMVIIQEELDSLYEIIDLCQKNDIRPIMITTPFRREYNEKFSVSFYEQFHDVIEAVCTDTGCEYYDFSHDERFVDSDEYFSNADHLSGEGAKAFTKILMEEVVDN